MPTLRTFLARGIEERLALLDSLDGDADFEPDADCEPSLGASEAMNSGTWTEHGAVVLHDDATRYADGSRDDREDENEHGGDIQDDPHDDDDPAEPSLGSLDGGSYPEGFSQERWARSGLSDLEDDQADREEDDRDRPAIPDWSGRGAHEATALASMNVVGRFA